MRHIVFQQSDRYPVCLLVKQSAMNKIELTDHVVTPLEQRGVPLEDILIFSLAYTDKNKAPITFIREYLAQLLPELSTLSCTTLLCMDAAYFKVLTKSAKADEQLGYVLPCVIEDFEHMNVVYCPNHKSVLYNPELQSKLDFALNTLVSAVTTGASTFGQSILRHTHYPSSISDIADALTQLLDEPALCCDIETFGLTLDVAGIATIAFSPNAHDGVAFAVDYSELPEPVVCPDTAIAVYGKRVFNKNVRDMLRWFFSVYQGQLSFHNATFDIKILIYELFMADPLDTQGLLTGLHTLCRDVHDTRILAYLSLNSTAMIKGYLGLKQLAHEYAGNYGVDVKNVLHQPLDTLLEYNLMDTCCTAWVYDKYMPCVVKDQQYQLYSTLMMPSIKTIIQMELTGLPICPTRVASAKQQLQTIRQAQLDIISASDAVNKTQEQVREAKWHKDFADRRAKAKQPEKIKPKDKQTFPDVVFNPNSGNQVQILLYSVLQLPVLSKTKKGQPSVGADTLENLVHHCTDPDAQALLKALVSFTQAEKILTTFIAAFEKAFDKGDGVTWLHGSFVLGGAKTGRMSSKAPNLQNLPSGSVYGKLIKQCIVAPEGWLWAGADFNSLEDYVSALTTRDPNKLKVYTDGYDGHSLRAYNYFPDEVPDVHAMMQLAEQPGKFYKQQLADGSFSYLHESELNV